MRWWDADKFIQIETCKIGSWNIFFYKEITQMPINGTHSLSGCKAKNCRWFLLQASGRNDRGVSGCRIGIVMYHDFHACIISKN